MIRPLILAAAICAVLCVPGASAAPPIKHVFVIVLENKDAAKTFADGSEAPYLAKTLRSQGVFVPAYYGIGHQSLDNYIAMISGQAPNVQTQADCQLFTDFAPATPTADGQYAGQGCVYPAQVKTLADQLDAKGLSWKGYMEDMGADPSRDKPACSHPAIGAHDGTQSASAKDQYATRHNPFVYFHSIIDDPARCDARDVNLDALPGDLASASKTPSLTFITPDLCHDGHDATCADGTAGGLKAADQFLQQWVPKIVGSPAFADGMLVVTFDEAENDGSACCDEQPGPNTPNPAGPEPGAGGGRVGAVILSPYTKPGTTSPQAYNHYSFLRSVEDLFGLEHLGYAGRDGLVPFGSDIYSNAAGTTVPAVAPAGARHCRTTSLAGKPRRLARGTLLASARVRRSGGRRVLAVRTTHYARIRVRGVASRLVQPCVTTRITLPRAVRGTFRVTASTARHAERRVVG